MHTHRKSPRRRRQLPPTITGRRGAPPRLAVLIGLVAWLSVVALPKVAVADAQPEHAATAATAAEGEQGGEHGESIWSFLSRLGNFVIFAGGLYYLLRSPFGRYLEARAQQIRSDSTQAAETRTQASARLAELERRLAALPQELEVLGARGKNEIAAEEERIRHVAEAERDRVLDQTRREIDRQLQLARRDLTEHAAGLAVEVARTRLSRELTDDQHLRLIDRYVSQVGSRHE